jgi:hypothetical protein
MAASNAGMRSAGMREKVSAGKVMGDPVGS